jgi:hypothetical protein
MPKAAARRERNGPGLPWLSRLNTERKFRPPVPGLAADDGCPPDFGPWPRPAMASGPRQGVNPSLSWGLTFKLGPELASGA